MSTLSPLRALAVALLLGACQAGTDGARSPAMGAASGGGEADAVLAFGQICGQLDRAGVAQRGGRYGFVPLQTEALPADLRETVTRTNGTLSARIGGPPAFLVWAEPANCELWVGGLDAAAVEREFVRFLRSVEDAAAGSRVMVTALTDAEVAAMPPSNGTRLRQGATINPRGLTPGPVGVMALRVPETDTRAIQVIMIHRYVNPQPGQAQPPAGRAAPIGASPLRIGF